jgi:hypothetical protein
MEERLNLNRTALEGIEIAVRKSVELPIHVYPSSAIPQFAWSECAEPFAKLTAYRVPSKALEQYGIPGPSLAWGKPSPIAFPSDDFELQLHRGNGSYVFCLPRIN